MRSGLFMTKLSKVPTIQNTELLNKIYTYLLVLFFILVSFRFTFFTNWQYINFTEVYFVLVFSTCCLLLLDSRDRKPAVFRWSFDTDLKICFIIFFGFLGVKLFYSSLISIWGDEISQFRASVLMGPFNGAAFHQQPPLDYFFSFWSDQLFGYSLLAVRAHVYFLTGLNLVFLYGLLRKFQISILAKCQLPSLANRLQGSAFQCHLKNWLLPFLS